MVHIASGRSTYRGLYPARFLADQDLDQRHHRWREIQSDSERNLVCVALDSRRHVVGFAVGHPVPRNQNGFASERGAIYLLPRVQHRGFGRALATAVVRARRRRKLRSLIVWVLAKNPSRGFNEALGGRVVGTRRRTHGGVRRRETAYGWGDLRSEFDSRKPGN